MNTAKSVSKMEGICDAIAVKSEPEKIVEMMHHHTVPVTYRFPPLENTILHKAVAAGHIDLIRHLHSLGFNFDAQDDLGQTALFVCKDLCTIKCLVECGADVSIKDDRGETAIINYIDWDASEEVEYLKSLGLSEKLQ